VRARDMILYFMHKHFPDPDNMVTPIVPLKTETEEDELKKIFDKDDFKEDFKTLNVEVRKLGYNIPPLVSTYMNLSPKMKAFGTAVNEEFGMVEETGILITHEEMIEEKKVRHIYSFIEEQIKRESGC